MNSHKKLARLLTEKLGGDFNVGRNGDITVRFVSGVARFESKSYELMTCTIDLGDGPWSFVLSKTFIFDIVHRLASPHLASTLRDYPQPPILQLSEYVDEENGAKELDELREQISADPSLESAELGGNRILVEYYKGVLIICDDLVTSGTNVVEM